MIPMTPTKPHLVVVGGTWEHEPYGLLGDVVNRTSDTWQPHWIHYPAVFGDPISYKQSKTVGIRQFISKLRHLAGRDPIAVIGYSQGAAIVEEALRSFARERDAGVLDQLEYVGLVASPYRPQGFQVGTDPGGFGISGALPNFRHPKPATSMQWAQFALPGDLITACPADSLIRIVEELVPAMSARDPLEWAGDLRQKLTVPFVLRHFPELRLPLRDLPRLVPRIRDAARAAAYYQTSGIHMKYATTPIPGTGLPATQIIAQELNEIAWQTR